MAHETFEPGDVVVLKNNTALKYTFLSDDGNGIATVLNMAAMQEKLPIVALEKFEPPRMNMGKILR